MIFSVENTEKLNNRMRLIRPDVELRVYDIALAQRVTEEALSRIESSRRTLEAAEAKMSVEEQYLEELEEQVGSPY